MAKGNPNSPANYGKAMNAAVKNTKVFGMPPKAPMKKKPMKMAPDMVAKRKKKMLSNAADKMFGQKYSK